MNETIYEDGTITVTATEIRAKGFVLYVDNVSSISVNTIRPGKWLGPFLAFPIVAFLGIVWFVNRMFGGIAGHQSNAAFIGWMIGVLPMAVVAVVVFLLRVSRLYLQTTGGPVLLASKISLTDPYETESRYKQIQEAIEKAKSLRKKHPL